MIKCERREECPLYKYFKTDELKKYYIEIYCEGEPNSCLRKKMWNEGKEIPEDLLPDGKRLSDIHKGGL